MYFELDQWIFDIKVKGNGCSTISETLEILFKDSDDIILV